MMKPPKWAVAICVTHSDMYNNANSKTGFGLHTIRDQVEEVCVQIAEAVISGDVQMIEDIDNEENW